MVKIYRKSVFLSSLSLSTNERLSDFYASSWQRGESPVPMLVCRLVLAGVALAILLWSVLEAPNPYWLIYLTNWGLVLDFSMLLCGIIVSLEAIYNKPQETKELPWYASLYWALFSIAVSISIMITSLYWLLLYDPNLRKEMGARAFWLDVSTHGIVSCVVLAELLLARTPVRLLHLYLPLGMGLWYAAFSAIFYMAGGTDMNGNHFIYDILDWSQGRRTSILVAASMAGLVAVYVCVWGAAAARDRLSAALVRTTSRDLPAAPLDRHSRHV